MLNTVKRGLFLVLSGPTCAGKGTICKELKKRNSDLWVSVSATTREKRDYEIDGVDYFFYSKEEFQTKIEDQEFIEYAVVHNNQYYGTPKSRINEYLDKGIDVILEIDIQGALQIKQKVKEAVFIFLLPPSMTEIKRRLSLRNSEDEEKNLERFKTAYKEINEYSTYNYVVVNDEIHIATKKIESIISAEKCRVDRILSVDLNTDEEMLHDMLTDNLNTEKSYYEE